MNNYIDLTKLFIKSLKLNKANSTSGKNLFRILLFICIFFIIIPFLFVFTVFTYSMLSDLKAVGYASIGYEALLSIISIFTFIFSFTVIVNQLYYSENIESLLPLPLKPTEIVSAKFTSCFLIENLMLFVLLFFSCFAYTSVMQIPLINSIITLPCLLLLPLIPMIDCAIVALLLMYLLKNIKKKNSIRRLEIFIAIILTIGIFLFFTKMTGFDFDAYIVSFAKGNHKFLKGMRILFPSNYFFVKSLDSISLSSLFLFLGINTLYVGLLLILAKKLYLPGLIGMFHKDTDRKKSSTELMKNMRQKDPKEAYLWKEIKLLFRSPTFFLNCILINIIWPIFTYILIKICFSKYSMSHIRYLLGIHDNSILIIILLFVIGISILVTAINSIASSSFSREGKNFHFIKYIPMSYTEQWKIKFTTSLIISSIGINVYTILFFLFLKMNIIYILLFTATSILSIIVISLIGVLIDSLFPKIVWDEEADSLRENYNSFIVMGFALLIFGILCGGGYLLYDKIHFSFSLLLMIIEILLLIMDMVLYNIGEKQIKQNLRNQENL